MKKLSLYIGMGLMGVVTFGSLHAELLEDLHDLSQQLGALHSSLQPKSEELPTPGKLIETLTNAYNSGVVVTGLTEENAQKIKKELIDYSLAAIAYVIMDQEKLKITQFFNEKLRNLIVAIVKAGPGNWKTIDKQLQNNEITQAELLALSELLEEGIKNANLASFLRQLSKSSK